MDDTIVGALHFIRPAWLGTIFITGFLWWWIRPRKTAETVKVAGIADHLARALAVGVEDSRKFYPIDGVAIALVLLAVAAAGPTWSRYPNPLLAQTAPLVVAVKVTPSMNNTDVQPSRQIRASFKILDLVKRRAGAQTALFAYAGSAHRVTPLTEDPNIIRSYLEGLSPSVMPVEGDRADLALKLSVAELERSETPGAILMVLDDLNPSTIVALNEKADDRPPIIFFVVGPKSLTLAQLDQVQNASAVHITPDDKDLDQIDRRVLSAYREALLADKTLSWDDKGWVIAWPAALFLLLWFRRGWTMQWVVALCVLVGVSGKPAQAEGIKDWFLTPDQQGQLAMQDKDYAAAALLFKDPEWRAYALFKSGKFADAVEAYGFVETPQGAFGEAMASLRNREYRDGVRGFEKSLKRDPDYEAARTNLAVAKAIVAYVEDAQSQSDTGEQGGIGADDTVYNNESGMGAETLVERESDKAPAGLTTDQWLRSVDTDVGDFLKFRFGLENAKERN
ncbi:MAG: VWA domain-containing protein [Ruegeria sp.]